MLICLDETRHRCLTYFLHFIQTFCLQMDMTQIMQNLKSKSYRTARLKYKFFKALLKVSSFGERLQLVNKIGQQVYLWRREQQGGTPSQYHYFVKSFTYPTLVTIDPLKVKIISILLYENHNRPMLFCTFTIDSSSFLTTV